MKKKIYAYVFIALVYFFPFRWAFIEHPDPVKVFDTYVDGGGVEYAIYMLIWLVALIKQAPIAIVLIVFIVMAAQVFWHWQLIRTRSREGCFKAFRLNHWLGFTMFLGVVATFALR